MTMFAGCFDRRGPGSIDPEIRSGLSTQFLSAADPEEVTTYSGPGIFVVNLDIGVFVGKGLVDDSDGGPVACLAGEPLLDGSVSGERRADLFALRDAWRQDQLTDVLRTARGVFSVMMVNPHTRQLLLATDKLGVRPVYYCETPEHIFFASALWILEKLSAAPKTIDLRGVAETVATGAALANRTPHASISILRDGEFRSWSDRGSSEQTHYWRWDNIPTSSAGSNELLSGVASSFQRAVDIRIGGSKSAIVFLSGGLDSRSIACVLKGRGLDVSTINVSRSGTKDAAYGRRFAEHLGTRHTQVEPPLGLAPHQYASLLPSLLSPGARLAQHGGRSTHIAWSGDGGSVGLGHVYVDEDLVEIARTRDQEACARGILASRQYGLPERVLQPAALAELRGSLLDGVKAELACVAPDDPGRSVYLFFLRNDQRRHLTYHFENLHESRVEYQLPFLDSEFLRSALTVPLDQLLRHAFYVRWVEYLPCDMTAVPWQVYPGHVAPDKDFADGRAPVDQWRDPLPAEWRRHRREEVLSEARCLLSSNPFPRPLIRRGILRAAYWLQRLGVRDTSYLLRAAAGYGRYWHMSQGKGLAG